MTTASGRQVRKDRLQRDELVVEVVAAVVEVHADARRLPRRFREEPAKVHVVKPHLPGTRPPCKRRVQLGPRSAELREVVAGKRGRPPRGR
jgi:hypothetical protein